MNKRCTVCGAMSILFAVKIRVIEVVFTGFGLGLEVIGVKLSTRVFFRAAGALRSLVGGGVVNSNVPVVFCDVRNVLGIRVSFVVLGSTINALKCNFSEIGFSSR